MARGKVVSKILLDSSKAALFAGIEIHNKPHIDYRYQASSILVVNAWELLLKAYIYKFIGKTRIYEKNSHTITFEKALNLVTEDINAKKGHNSFRAVKENLELINEYRCDFAHFGCKEIEPVLFMLMSKTILNYSDFISDYFNKDITQDDNLFILPIGLKLPVNPISFFKQSFTDKNNAFTEKVINVVKSLYGENIQDCILVEFDIFAKSIRNVNNADIVAAIDNTTSGINLNKRVQFTDDPAAPMMRIEDAILPLTYDDLKILCKERFPEIKFSDDFNKAKKRIQQNTAICRPRYLNPKTKKVKQFFYSYEAVDALIEQYVLITRETNNE